MRARRILRRATVAAVTGALTVSVAWAGVGLMPVKGLGESVKAPAIPGLSGRTTTAGAAALPVPPPGRFLVGAAKVSIEPKPAQYGGVWQKSGCATLDVDAGKETVKNLPDQRLVWPENPNCIYRGGFSIGPVNPLYSWDQTYGLWVRALVISDGHDTLVLGLIDGTSYFGDYKNMCSGCGAFDMGRELGAQYGFDPKGFLFASSHSHTAPDFIGGWGGVPNWYMNQVHDAVRTAVGNAFASLKPAVIEDGEVFARQFNHQRRDFYRSAEDNSMSWLRAYDPTNNSVIATLGAYPAHPVTAPHTTEANADFTVVFERDAELEFGGIGFFFQTGLGNMSPAGSTEQMGDGLEALIPNLGAGQLVQGTDVRTAQVFWKQPITNSVLLAGGVAGGFDRPYALGKTVVDEGTDSVRRCRSVSPVGVKTAVEAAKVGDLVFTGAPGEIFSNGSNTIEEQNATHTTFALGQVDDGLGYMMQSFETDHAGRQGLGFVGSPFAEYEDAFSIDACFGDAALEKTLALLQTI